MFHHHRNSHANLQVGRTSKDIIWVVILSLLMWPKQRSPFLICSFIFFSPDSPVKSPCKSPFKRSVIPGSFYGKQKPAYLTPLERKAIKESLPSPSPPPPLASPPAEGKKKSGKKKNLKGGRKSGKMATGSKKTEKLGIQRFTTTAKTIKLTKMNSRLFSKLICLNNQRSVLAVGYLLGSLILVFNFSL